MQIHRLVFSLAVGCLLIVGQSAGARTEQQAAQAAKSSPPSKTAELSSHRTVGLDFLDKDGAVIGQVFVEDGFN